MRRSVNQSSTGPAGLPAYCPAQASVSRRLRSPIAPLPNVRRRRNARGEKMVTVARLFDASASSTWVNPLALRKRREPCTEGLVARRNGPSRHDCFSPHDRVYGRFFSSSGDTHDLLDRGYTEMYISVQARCGTAIRPREAVTS